MYYDLWDLWKERWNFAALVTAWASAREPAMQQKMRSWTLITLLMVLDDTYSLRRKMRGCNTAGCPSPNQLICSIWKLCLVLYQQKRGKTFHLFLNLAITHRLWACLKGPRPHPPMEALESEPMTTPPSKVAARMVVWGRTESQYEPITWSKGRRHADEPVLGFRGCEINIKPVILAKKRELTSTTFR